MNEDQFGFEYSWEDLRPVRSLMLTMYAAQVLGAIAGLFVLHTPEWVANLVAGAGAVTFPGFVVGLAVQNLRHPGTLGENRVMVRRVGLVAAAISGIVFLIVKDHAS